MQKIRVFTDLTSLGSSEVLQLERVWRSFPQLQEFDIKVSQNALLHKKHEKSYHLLQTGLNLFMWKFGLLKITNKI
jgi:hypothetical protein